MIREIHFPAMIGAGVSVAALAAAGSGLWPRMHGYRDELERQRQLLGSNPDLRDLVRMARLAANGHHTQPWKFQLAEQNVTILPDLTRRTEVVDPDDPHLYVSLGCAAENLVIAAAAQGRAAEVAIDVLSVRPDVASWLGLPGVRTDLVIRFGRAPRCLCRSGGLSPRCCCGPTCCARMNEWTRATSKENLS